jgi:rhodanese-related sulfurtransferase
MVRNIQYALTALPLGLVLAGCAGSHDAEPRTAQAAPARAYPTDVYVGEPAPESTAGPRPQMAERPAGPTTRPDQILGYTIAPESRYDVNLDEIHGYVFNHAAVLIDARSAAAFARSHLRGAYNLPAGQLQAYYADIEKRIPRDRLIIIYCNSANCGSADMVYEYLAARGYTNMRVFKPGWEVLSKAEDLR